jgi:putative membrane protein
MGRANKVNMEDPKLEEPIIRDFMAIERPMMANEWIFLSYVRKALGLVIAGVFCIDFFDNIFMQLVGWAFIPSGFIAFGIGCRKYQKISSLI